MTVNKTSELYKRIKPSVVAVVSKISKNPDFPDIIGTGFIVSEDGIILTNNHVIEAIKNLPRRKDEPNSLPIRVIFFHNIPNEGLALVPLEVEGVTTSVMEKKTDGRNYGQDIPDIGAIFVKAKGLPFLEIDEKLSVDEGDDVIISGFPIGTDTLRSLGWIHQLTPVLQKGIVSAILPFVCDSPHSILVEAVTHGGSSGSPIINIENGKVVAILFGGMPENKVLAKTNDGKIITYQNSTSLTYAIPSPLLHIIYKKILDAYDLETNTPLKRDTSTYKSLDEIVSTYKKFIREPKKISVDGLEIIDPDNII